MSIEKINFKKVGKKSVFNLRFQINLILKKGI